MKPLKERYSLASRRPQVALVNAGTHPELVHAAVGARDAGLKVLYLTASMWPAQALWGRGLRSLARGRFRADLEARTLPASLRANDCKCIGVPLDLLFTLARRLRLPGQNNLLALRNWYFELRASSICRRKAPDIVVAQSTVASRVFAKSPEPVLRVLNCPIAHQRWSAQLFAAEASDNPAWRDFLQGANVPANVLRRIDEETALADVALAGSSFTARSLVEEGVQPGKIRIIPLGADIDGPIVPMRPPEGALRVLFCGQVNQRKGVGYLVEAMARLPRASLDVRWVGPIDRKMEQRLREAGYSQIYGSVSRREVSQQMAWAELVVLPSLVEGFALTAIEAMFSGRAVIVSTNTLGDGVITSGIDGFVVEPRNAEQLAEKISWCLQNRGELRKIGIQARSRAMLFTWAKYEERMGALLRDLWDTRDVAHTNSNRRRVCASR